MLIFELDSAICGNFNDLFDKNDFNSLLSISLNKISSDLSDGKKPSFKAIKKTIL